MLVAPTCSRELSGAGTTTCTWRPKLASRLAGFQVARLLSCHGREQIEIRWGRSESDSLAQYLRENLREIGRHRLLTPAEEVRLAAERFDWRRGTRVSTYGVLSGLGARRRARRATGRRTGT